MSFTDEDLKRLKEQNGEPVIWFGDAIGKWGHIYRVTLKTEDVSALIARLEAAERLLDASFNPEDIDPFDYEAWHKRFETWRKAKGEAPESDSERAGRDQE